MDIEYMKEFSVLAKYLNFTAAANELFISQSALSKHIVQMERELDSTLLERTKHSVMLTDSGLAFLSACKDIIERYDRTFDDITMVNNGMSGKISVGMLYYGLNDWALPVLVKMKKDYPKIIVETYSYQPPQLKRDLANGIVDIGQVYRISQGSSDDSDDIEYCDIGKLGFSLMVPLSSPLRNIDSISLKDLDGMNLVQVARLPELTGYIMGMLSKKGIYIKRFIYTQHVDTIAMDVQLNKTPSIVSNNVRDIPEKGIKFIDITDPDMYIMASYAYRKANKNKSIKHFIKAAKETFLVTD